MAFRALNTQRNAGNMDMNTINKWDRDAEYICIDENELRLATSNQFDDIDDIITNNFNYIDTVAITRGPYGCIIYKDGELTEVPAFTTKIVDSIGSGDAFLALSSTMVNQDAPRDIIGFIGNCAGAIASSYRPLIAVLSTLFRRSPTIS